MTDAEIGTAIEGIRGNVASFPSHWLAITSRRSAMHPHPGAKPRFMVSHRAPPIQAAVKEAYERGMANLQAESAERDRIKAEFVATPGLHKSEKTETLQRGMMPGGM